jgi:hypothetical protein
LQADVARELRREALGILREYFADARAAGPQMAVRAAGVRLRLARPDLRLHIFSLPAEVVAASCAALASELLDAHDADRQ